MVQSCYTESPGAKCQLSGIRKWSSSLPVRPQICHWPFPMWLRTHSSWLLAPAVQSCCSETHFSTEPQIQVHHPHPQKISMSSQCPTTIQNLGTVLTLPSRPQPKVTSTPESLRTVHVFRVLPPPPGAQPALSFSGVMKTAPDWKQESKVVVHGSEDFPCLQVQFYGYGGAGAYNICYNIFLFGHLYVDHYFP